MSSGNAAAVPLAVTGVGVVTPWGDEPARAAAGGGRPAGDEPWFDHRRRLGPRGYKYLPPAARYALAAARAAAADGGRPGPVPEDRRGLLLATNAGLAGVFDAMDAAVVEQGAQTISPASAPYFAVNVLGNRLAVEFGLKGFALTVATARTAALDALSTGALALAAGRCDALLLAAAEEPLPATRGGGGEQGAVALALEPLAAAEARGARVRAVLRSRSLFLPPAALADAGGRAAAQRALAGALGALAESGGEPGVLLPDLDSSAVAETVAVALAGLPRRPRPDAPEPPTPSGAGCLGPALALARAVTEAGGGTRLVVSATEAGQVALVSVAPQVNRHAEELQHAEIA
ncbi:beta-ketoacyl synthase N-terminal-like domain-containing protein [Streptomyces sp. NPDC052052]|uniref:beta-ketoacyl synthase N-terminal-like domain-containing protein n=1 Tax=Streptomyces sp. NPDC052052 TaxID=3154756 RepID=UPI003436B17B